MGAIGGSNRADRLRGTDGDEWVVGWRGNDGLTGGGGADTFLFGRGHGQDWIMDFNPVQGDRVVLSGVSQREAAWFQHEHGVELRYGSIGGTGQDSVFFLGATSVAAVAPHVHLIADDWFA